MGSLAITCTPPKVYFDGKEAKPKIKVVYPVGKNLKITIQKSSWVKHASFRFYADYQGKKNYINYSIGLGKLSGNKDVWIPGFYLTSPKKQGNINLVYFSFFDQESKLKKEKARLSFGIQLSGKARPVQEKIKVQKTGKKGVVNLEISDAAGIEYVAVRRPPSGYGKVYAPPEDTSTYYLNAELAKTSKILGENRNEHFQVQEDKLIVAVSVKEKTEIQVSIRRNEEWSGWSKLVTISP